MKLKKLFIGILMILLLCGCKKDTVIEIKDMSTIIKIENNYGTAIIDDEELANSIIEVLNDKSNMTRAGCGFGNQTKIIKNNKILAEFIIADDGCPSLKVSNNMFDLPNVIYNQLETHMQKNNNSLAHSIGQLHLLNEQNDSKPVMLFELYVVKDIKTDEAINMKLDELKLEEKPILVSSEILQYDWINHQITLNDDTLEKELYGRIPTDGLPFVVIADGIRIYQGAFWTPISSVTVPKIPIISAIGSDKMRKTYKIELAHPEAIEVRNDKRIHSVLERSGILKETSFDVENSIYRSFSGKNTGVQAKKEIFDVLKDIDWKRYNEVSNGHTIELLEWIDSLNISDENGMTTIFKATKNLGGAFAEKYSLIVGKMYIHNKTNFIKYLSNMQYGDSKITEITGYVTNYLSYYPDEYKKHKEETNSLMKRTDYTEQDKIIVQLFLNEFNKSDIR